MVLYLPFELSAMTDASLWITAFVRYFVLGVWLILGAPIVFKALGLHETDAGTKKKNFITS